MMIVLLFLALAMCIVILGAAILLLRVGLLLQSGGE